jgi:hypothetical protein
MFSGGTEPFLKGMEEASNFSEHAKQVFDKMTERG